MAARSPARAGPPARRRRRRARAAALAAVVAALAWGGAPDAGGGAPDAGTAHPESGAAADIRALVAEGRHDEAERLARARLAALAEGGGAPDTLDAAEILDALVTALLRAGRVRSPDLADLAGRALAIREARLDPDDPRIALSLASLAEVHEETGGYALLRPLRERALGILERSRGPDHPDAARALADLARARYHTGDMAGAQADFERALGLQEARLDPGHPDIARTLIMMATVLMRRGEYARALPPLERALAIREAALGSDHPETSEALNALGNHARLRGDLDEARRLYERALAIRLAVSGDTHHRAATILTNLAIVRHLSGDYGGSLADHGRALAIREAALGPDHPEVGNSLNNLALALSETGRRAEARPLLERSLAIKEKQLGPDHPDLGTTLSNLANLHTALNEPETALTLLARVIAIYETSLGPEAPRLVAPLTLAADLAARTGDRAGARARLDRALRICETRLPAGHDDTADVIEALADLAGREGDRAAAEAGHGRALRIREAAFGGDHPLVARSLAALASLRMDGGEAAAAVPLLERAAAIEEKAAGEANPHLAGALALLARAHAMRGAAGAAIDAGLRAEAIARRYFQDTIRYLSEAEALRFEGVRASGLDAALSVLPAPAAGGERDSARVARVWDQVVASRARVLDEFAARRRSVTEEAAGPESRAAADALERARFRLARLVVRGPEAGDAGAHAARVRAAQEERDRAERALALASAPFRAALAGRALDLAAVRAALPQGAALVAFVRYERVRPVDDPERAGEAAYAAFVLGPGGSAPVAVDLGAARTLDDLVEAWRRLAGAAPGALAVAARRDETRVRRAAERLRLVAWDPIAPHLDGARTAFLVPDGALNLVSFAALPSASGRYLAEDGPLIHYLSAERDLARDRSGWRPGTGLLALGDPDFDADPRAAAGPGGAAPAAALRGARAACGDYRSLRFRRLPRSRSEAETVAALWRPPDAPSPPGGAAAADALTFTGPRASESEFKRSAPGRRVVHIATHAFWLPETCPSLTESARRGSVGAAAGTAPPPAADNPLLLSGFALAGANRRDRIDPAAPVEDGVLTAEEVAALDLRGVEWAVLSACQTGLGVVRSGEGVLGLRRAFEVAGARTLIMSLWPVEDAAAQDWMRRLYEARASGLGTAESVRRAAAGMIAARREAGRPTHPFYWAAFVAAGDWR